MHNLPVHMQKKAPQTETVGPSYPKLPPGHLQKPVFDSGSRSQKYPQRGLNLGTQNFSVLQPSIVTSQPLIFALPSSFFVLYLLHDAKKFSAYKGFHMSLTTQQPKGQCVWGARVIILVTGKQFAEK